MIPALFNPSNDMALASGLRQYFPPKRIQQMEEDLASVSRFWDEGPWGWSLASKNRYLQMGVERALLPSDEWLETVRQLSARSFACDYLARMLPALSIPSLVGSEMHFCCNLEDTSASPLIFKSPWSSSGRGIVIASDGITDEVRQRLQGFLRTQGGFLQDRFYADKRVDFAMEFLVHPDHSVEFLGYSVFHTGERGAYGGNVLASQTALKQLTGVDPFLLDALVDYHLCHLGAMDYHGPVGIDMMALDGGRVHPMVEMNLRMTMGVLALLLYRAGVTSDQPLTPFRAHGFQMVVRHGLLTIDYRP